MKSNGKRTKTENSTLPDLAEIEVHVMKTLIEKFERLVATILEALDTEQGNGDRVSQSQDGQCARDLELNTDAHHTLIEPCW